MNEELNSLKKRINKLKHKKPLYVVQVIHDICFEVGAVAIYTNEKKANKHCKKLRDTMLRETDFYCKSSEELESYAGVEVVPMIINYHLKK